MIVIAHRITTLQYCDCIYQLEKAEIVWSGDYEQLLNKK
jgi:ATP-binding cassette, subfamily B, bacterial PglK